MGKENCKNVIKTCCPKKKACRRTHFTATPTLLQSKLYFFGGKTALFLPPPPHFLSVQVQVWKVIDLLVTCRHILSLRLKNGILKPNGGEGGVFTMDRVAYYCHFSAFWVYLGLNFLLSFL